MKLKWIALLIAVLMVFTGCSKDSTTNKQDSKEEQTKITKVTINKKSSQNFYVVTTAKGQEITYAYYVYKENKIVKKYPYKQNPRFSYTISKPGKYKVRVFVKGKNGKIAAKTTKSILMKK